MNKQRRKKLSEISDTLSGCSYDLEEVLYEENESIENLPESLQDSERAENMRNAADNIEEAISTLQDAIGYISDAMDWKDEIFDLQICIIQKVVIILRRERTKPEQHLLLFIYKWIRKRNDILVTVLIDTSQKRTEIASTDAINKLGACNLFSFKYANSTHAI